MAAKELLAQLHEVAANPRKQLDKYLADMGKGTRTELKEMIRKGRIKVNGEVVKKPETKIRKGRRSLQ